MFLRKVERAFYLCTRGIMNHKVHIHLLLLCQCFKNKKVTLNTNLFNTITTEQTDYVNLHNVKIRLIVYMIQHL